MPSKNIVKFYLPNNYYHLYTRGVNKRKIFKDQQDYEVFLQYLKLYLTPVDELKDIMLPGIRMNKFIRNSVAREVDLSAFALMPNHIHLLVKQITLAGAEKLMRRVLTAYAMYFNQKYRRVGVLFQSRYKAAHVTNDEYLLYLSRYIHKNPIKIKQNDPYEFTSFPYYTRRLQASWVKPNEILKYFVDSNKALSYRGFVEDSDTISLGDLTLE